MLRFTRNAALVGALALASGCTAINEHRGYVAEPTLINSIHPGIDNQQSVEQTLGRPSFTSQFGPPVWYYVSRFTKQEPFQTPRVYSQLLLAVAFDQAGNVTSAKTSGVGMVVRIRPDSDKTPTLGRERTFLQDLFGNIGQVGAATGGSGQPSNTGGGGGPGG